MSASKFILCLILVSLTVLSACSDTEPQRFSAEELATALVEVAAERTQAAQLPENEPQPWLSPSAQTEKSVSTEEAPASQTDPHGDGIYLVGVDIAPGLWRSISSESGFCYWARRKYDGIILSSYYGLPETELLIRVSDYEVELDGCGVWVYMGPR